MTLDYTLSGTLDRGDGEPDIEWGPPPCPDRCGGDAFLVEGGNPNADRSLERWHCGECGGTWDGWGDEVSP